MSRKEGQEDSHALATEFLDWVKGNSEEAIGGEPPPRAPFVRLEPADMAVWELERLAEFRRRTRDDDYFWLDAVRSAHLALTAAMVVALEGSSGVGAMTVDAAKATQRYFDSPDWRAKPWPIERTMSFQHLITALQEPKRLEFSGPIDLSTAQRVELRELNDLREKIDHPKFTRWSVPAEAMNSATLVAAQVFEPVMCAALHRFSSKLQARARAAIQLCLQV